MVLHSRSCMTDSGCNRLQTSERTIGVDCPNGYSECRGNIDQLCAMHHYSRSVPALSKSFNHSEAQGTWWKFVQCLNEHPERIGELVDPYIAEYSKDCAKSVGIDWSGPGSIGMCADWYWAKRMHELNVVASQDMGIRYVISREPFDCLF